MSDNENERLKKQETPIKTRQHPAPPQIHLKVRQHVAVLKMFLFYLSYMKR